MVKSSALSTSTVNKPLARTRIKMLITLTLAALAGSTATFSYATSTLRCGSQLVSTGDRAFEVQQKCGEPVSQEVLGTQETFNSTYRRSEAVRIEEWVYGPDNGMYQYLRFEGGRLVRIESKRRN
ncbi:hypothetical protein ALO95_03566 [Pseudomonas syringae pv. antirrhini]|uniref:Uncharacterized protein n=1 Tax=Pseudomonas syringae pv. spinaceae TaxID=264459 RepID=A0A0Q0CKB1_PSESX|nr:Uncharacterized protein AC502_1486 [Pseudomonas syringae pv. maculicola]KPC07713.1 Uncharacterized protein AC500_2814 [Pseudomonas amygdali pv. lachrymans]KPW40340.1 Uncharacterized protein ALO87_03740 [Pseudomonas syringae pv. apii]KPY85459.1 Uncharacterized protein ALO94_04274 [Pseudomonas syringae pv. spinaceae]KPY89372.1 Uncharacterized protein ALO36_03533 [Pseudomonas syringae pv. tomato]RMM05618.1 hypothetical protein ALQ85_00002 [Pseudomonas syringae]RMP28766.1 hypothetical protein 